MNKETQTTTELWTLL